METTAPLLKRPKYPTPVKDVDGNKFCTLPQSVIHHIFSFLEIIDVMRASSVSKEWRYLWTTMPRLDFDYEATLINPCRRTFPCPLEYEKYKDFINWVLMSHDKSVCIQSFRLSCMNNNKDNSLYRWLHILADKHVQQLYLNVYSNNNKPFALPCCVLVSDSLEVLELNLKKSVFNVPSHSGFSRLKSLKLENTQLSDQNLFRNFISSCPVLQDLSFVRCVFQGFTNLDITLENLINLVINCDDCESSETKFEVKISCPKLLYFDLRGPLVQHLNWDKTPSFLRTAVIIPSWSDDTVPNQELASCLMKILKPFCNVENLKLGMRILELISPAVGEPGCFSVAFHNLKSLELDTRLEKCYFQAMIYLLKCAPNLQTLLVLVNELYFGFGCDYNDWKIPLPDEDIACLRCNLKMVKLNNMDSDDRELELIRFFLKNGHVLEKISINWHKSINPKARTEAIEKVTEFPRSSSDVAVSFSEPL